jgi:cobyrinic acid a,c-diamide synthase
MPTESVPSDLPGVVVAGTSSGVGKTIATLAVCRALERAGKTPVAAKAGPDFIDPSHHAAALGRPSRTLDPWLSGDRGLRQAYARGADDGDVCVVEGMMGLYDGDVSTAAVASALDLPVILVVDASGGMESVAATGLGFQRYTAHVDHDVDVVGLLASRAHSGRHERGIRNAIAELRYVGRIPPLDGLEIPDRHLGLHAGDEAPVSDDALDAAARQIETERLLDIARPPAFDTTPSLRAADETGVRVAVATDDAFRFMYPSTADRLRDRAVVEQFSPVAGDAVPECDAVYLPGGYPERHAAALAASPTLDELGDLAARDVPIFGECGGMMILGESLATEEGDHEMAGILPVQTRMTDAPGGLDHVGVRATRDTLVAPVGETRRGHEFHYSSAAPASDARYAFEMVRGAGIDGANDGLVEYRTLGTYTHFHPGSGVFDYLLETV